MHIERINENQIKVTITNSELSAYQMTVKELKYGNKKSEALFQSILEEAEKKFNFNPNKAPISMEAVPFREHILFVFTVAQDNDEADPTFANFRDEKENAANLREDFSFQVPPNIEIRAGIMECENIDAVIAVSHLLKDYRGGTKLYRGRQEHRFYYVIEREPELDSAEFLKILNGASEFGNPVAAAGITMAYLREHREPVLVDPHRYLQ